MILNLKKDYRQIIESRFGEVDEYKEEQIKILQAEIDEQVKVRYEEADQYKIEQLKVLQSEIDQQVVARYDEADQYRDSQITQVKAEMYKKFNMSVPTVNPVTPKNVADFIINNFEDEDKADQWIRHEHQSVAIPNL